MCHTTDENTMLGGQRMIPRITIDLQMAGKMLTELPKLGRHYEPEALDQFLPWVMTEKIPPLK
jgi:hypothetical protein